ETILLVEDEPKILKLTTAMLGGWGYTVLAAGRPSEAIRLAEEHSGSIDLLLTDVTMPEMNGHALAKLLKSSQPELKCLFMSGYTTNIITAHGELEDGGHFLSKPFRLKDLAAKIRETLGS
ncbi:MAG: response regulator, partial [Chloroflexi bacterium]|nr:response regulator [Chloroflexota bacterium]